ncbi:phosphotransferase enzyme family protein [Micromonospora echinaurantiaca]|uniref:phosphotransferase enzyme family protein n=1 Tax=Micromonospora echinaurantiaca TaxID=47857 RepID=UPI00378D2207
MADDPLPLTDWVHHDFGVRLTATEPVDLGADRRALLWRAESADGDRYAVKLSGGGTPAGLMVSAHLAGQGVPGIPAPLPGPDGRPWTVRDGRRLSVLPWVSDDRALGGAMTDAHWRSYGEVLARVHAAEVTDELAGLLPPGGGTHPAVLATLRAVDERVGRHRPGDRLADELVRIWSTAAGPVAELAAAVEPLGAELRDRPGRAVVCHGDPHLGNLLLGPAGRIWLIDWDDAVLAPPECDLMFVFGGVLAFAPVTAVQQAAFRVGYGPTEPDPARLAWFLTVRALDDLGDWAGQVLDVARAEGERRQALDIVRGLISPDGLVTLARAALRGSRPARA